MYLYVTSAKHLTNIVLHFVTPAMLTIRTFCYEHFFLIATTRFESLFESQDFYCSW